MSNQRIKTVIILTDDVKISEKFVLDLGRGFILPNIFHGDV